MIHLFVFFKVVLCPSQYNWLLNDQNDPVKSLGPSAVPSRLCKLFLAVFFINSSN